LHPRSQWRQAYLKPGESLTLKPGQFVLGRTYEKFSIPEEYAGKLEGRSSFARMGLAIHCSGDFINPHWRGHMPIQLINLGSQTIKIFPYLPICQLILITLTSRPEHLYGERELQSKYMDDDGGPSYWWRDKRIRLLQTKFGERDITVDIQDRILNTIGYQEIEVLERFETFFANTDTKNLSNADLLLDTFAKSEDKRRLFITVSKWLVGFSFTAFFALSLRQLFFSPQYTISDFIVWAITILLLPLAYYMTVHNFGDHLGEREVNHIRAQQKQA
jgi:dUTPase